MLTKTQLLTSIKAYLPKAVSKLITYSYHAEEQMSERGVTKDMVLNALLTGEVDDVREETFKGTACYRTLITSILSDNTYFLLVVAVYAHKVHVITVYPILEGKPSPVGHYHRTIH